MSGIFGVISKNDCTKDLYYGTDYQSHMGTAFAGLAVFGKKQIIHKLNAQFKSKFEEDLPKLAGATAGIGAVSAYEEQPIPLLSRFGIFHICTNGRIKNLDEITEELLAEGWSFSEVSYEKEITPNQTLVAGKIIAKQPTIVSGIETLFEKIDGSLSLLILNEEGIFAARSKHGQNPLVIGAKKDNSSWAVTGESCAFNNLGYETIKELLPSEIALITAEGPKTIIPGQNTGQLCSFLWIYTSFPASTHCGVNVELARYRSGSFLAERDFERGIKADIVAGVPESGTAHAIGYSCSGIPYQRGLVKYTPGWDRSYTPTRQEERDLIAQMKIIAIPEIVRGKRIVLCDDSIVRGTQLKNYALAKLWNAGAKEIHVRPACPPLLWPCKYNISTRTMEELIARRMIKEIEGTLEPKNIMEYVNNKTDKHKQMVELIRKHIGATTLYYQRLEDMIEAIGLPKCKLCTYCWEGEQKGGI